jgi:hypothetical protein
MSLIQTTVFWFTVANLLLVVALFIWRGIYRGFPFFFLYIVSAVLVGAARYVAYRVHPKLYFYVFWFSEFSGFFIVTLALYEVSLKRLFPVFFRFRFYRILFPILAVIVPVISIQVAMQAPDKRAVFLMINRGYDAARAAVLVLVVGLMIFMGRFWKRYDFGILFGFAMQAAAAVLKGLARAQSHYQVTIWDTVETFAFGASCLIWLITFWKPEKGVALRPLDPTATEALQQARTWQSALKEWLIPGKHSDEV